MTVSGALSNAATLSILIWHTGLWRCGDDAVRCCFLGVGERARSGERERFLARGDGERDDEWVDEEEDTERVEEEEDEE